jgi:hypothetical protein
MGGFEVKRCYIQLDPMGVNNVLIEGEMVDGLVQKICQK